MPEQLEQSGDEYSLEQYLAYVGEVFATLDTASPNEIASYSALQNVVEEIMTYLVNDESDHHSLMTEVIKHFGLALQNKTQSGSEKFDAITQDFLSKIAYIKQNSRLTIVQTSKKTFMEKIISQLESDKDKIVRLFDQINTYQD